MLFASLTFNNMYEGKGHLQDALIKAGLGQKTPDSPKSRGREKPDQHEKRRGRDNIEEKERLEAARQEMAELRKAERALHAYWEQRCEVLKKTGLPIRKEDGRIDMDIYGRYASEGDIGRIYSDRRRHEHLRTVNDVQAQKEQDKRNWEREVPPELRSEYSAGENFEVLSLAILDKVLRNLCVILRGSYYDDDKNSADIVVFDRLSGEVICIFDDIANQDQKRERKAEKLTEINQERGGTTLTYGLTFDELDKIRMTELNNIPVFYLSISPQRLKQIIKEFEPDSERLADSEKKFFAQAYHELQAQVIELMEDYDLSSVLQNNLEKFKTRILNDPQLGKRVDEFDNIIAK